MTNSARVTPQISTDYEDLWATMAFFKGDENGRGAHDSLAKHIATEGKKWTEKHWRWADMEVCESRNSHPFASARELR